MRRSTVISIALHAAILVWAVAIFPSARLDAPPLLDVPVDVISPSEFTKLKAGMVNARTMVRWKRSRSTAEAKGADRKDGPKPEEKVPDKEAEAKPKDEPNRREKGSGEGREAEAGEDRAAEETEAGAGSEEAPTSMRIGSRRCSTRIPDQSQPTLKAADTPPEAKKNAWAIDQDEMTVSIEADRRAQGQDRAMLEAARAGLVPSTSSYGSGCNSMRTAAWSAIRASIAAAQAFSRRPPTVPCAPSISVSLIPRFRPTNTRSGATSSSISTQARCTAAARIVMTANLIPNRIPSSRPGPRRLGASHLAKPALAVIELNITQGTIQPLPIAIPDFAGDGSIEPDNGARDFRRVATSDLGVRRVCSPRSIMRPSSSRGSDTDSGAAVPRLAGGQCAGAGGRPIGAATAG